MEGHLAEHAGPGVMELIQLANIVIVLAILYFGARKAVVAGVAARSEMIAKKIVGSKEELAKVQAELGAAKRDLDKIEDLKKQILSQVRSEGEKLSQGILLEAKNVAARIVSDAKVAADDEMRVAVRQLREKVVHESIQKAGVLLADASKLASENKMHEKMIAGFVEDVKNYTPSSPRKGGA